MPSAQTSRTELRSEPAALLKLLSNQARWQLVGALAASDLKVNELVESVGVRPNLVSYHLGQLRRASVVSERRSSADARDIYYSLNLERLQAAFERCAGSIHPFLWPDRDHVATGARGPSSAEPPARVLFLCTHNSARSQMAEAILRNYGGDAVQAYSAGSRPTRVHPLAVRALTELGVDANGLQAKSLSAFAGDRFDYVITVCDIVRETCPAWSGEPELIHWSLADPNAVEASEEEALTAFRSTASELDKRVHHLLAAMARARAA
jgi:protein-tyrosine-phosphatase/DNA-binding transcriptional ArsR family regulator